MDWSGRIVSLRRLSGAVPITVASQQDGRGLDVNPGLSVWSLDVLPVMMWNPSPTVHMQVSRISSSKLPVGVNVGASAFLPPCVSPVIN